MKNIFKGSKLYFLSFVIIASVACNHADEKDATLKNKQAPNAAFKPATLKDTIGGIYHEYYKNGKIKMSGAIKEGKRDGDWSYFYESGKIWSIGEYIGGLRNGPGSVYYENGVLRMEGNYANDKQVGIWKFYNEQAKLIKEVKM